MRFAVLCILLLACKKDDAYKPPPEPPVRYGELSDSELDKQWNSLRKRA